MNRAAGGQGGDSRDGGQTHEGQAEVVLSLASEMLEKFGAVRLAARGSSMVPSIYPGDILMIRRETARYVRRGDIVLSFREGRFCAHRLVEKVEVGERLSLATRGDALAQTDSPIAEDELIGRVTAVLRRGKRIQFDANPSRRELLLRWAVRHSSGAAKWLLRWHLLRARLALDPGRNFAGAPPESLECA